MSLSGAITALVTPFKKDKSLDLEALKRLVRFQIEGGINGLAVCGTTGEGATLNYEEYGQVVRAAVSEANGQIPLIAGAGSNDTQKAVHLAQIVKEAGADGLLIVSPYYNKPTPNGLVAHYKTIGEAVDLPIILYNVPGRTGSNVLPQTVLRLAKEVPQVIGIKEASGNITQVAEVLKDAPKDFVLFSGDDSVTFASMVLGGKGGISVVANEVPKEFSELCRLALNGEWSKAKEINFRLLKLMRTNFIETNPIPVKTALAMMGKIEENFRLPLCPLEEKNRPALEKALKELNLI
ncbi:4-hydroxy-tetrahydrodipicolinate synthase [Patescibacteria group bacterium]|nr:4-hydroxy-tetrahydrodipicolinate synthase [Patescibacteria group bacterium]MBU4481578.1 4-hydroxy-tetrahydrodipicolinate synthase [Patescibacteria group bacterium]